MILRGIGGRVRDSLPITQGYFPISLTGGFSVEPAGEVLRGEGSTLLEPFGVSEVRDGLVMVVPFGATVKGESGDLHLEPAGVVDSWRP